LLLTHIIMHEKCDFQCICSLSINFLLCRRNKR
jgi:hypothetical protein